MWEEEKIKPPSTEDSFFLLVIFSLHLFFLAPTPHSRPCLLLLLLLVSSPPPASSAAATSSSSSLPPPPPAAHHLALGPLNRPASFPHRWQACLPRPGPSTPTGVGKERGWGGRRARPRPPGKSSPSILWPSELEEVTREEDEFVSVDSRSDTPARRRTDKRVLK